MRVESSYRETFTEAELARHAELLRGLCDETPVAVDTALLSDGRWQVTVAGFNHPGELSIICGLLFAHGFNIVDGNAFSEEHVAGGSTAIRPPNGGGGAGEGAAAKFVDVFTVEPAEHPDVGVTEVWRRYTAELAGLIREARSGRVRRSPGTPGQARGRRDAGRLRNGDHALPGRDRHR